MHYSELAKKSIELANQIIEEDYYTSRFYAVLKQMNISLETLRELNHSDSELIMLWNEFWFLLPDSPVIRTKTFFDLCDLCDCHE